MKTIATLTFVALFALTAGNAFATLIAYEPYNYALNSAPTSVSGTPTQTSGGGFSSGYNGGGLTTVAGLTYPGLTVNFNALKQTAAYSGENLSSPVSSGTVYISYLFNMSGNPGGNKVGLEMNTGGNGMFVGVTTPVSGTTGKLGVNQQVGYNDAGPNKWEASTANITYGSTYFIVVKLTGTGSGWTGSIWVNPTANTGSEPAVTGTFTMPQFTISACSIVNPAGAGGNFLFDELRIATTWTEAVTYSIPAPSAPTGLGATAGGNSVNLSWTAAAGSPASYNVKRSATSGSGYVTISSPGAVTGTSFTDAVAGGATYYYVVSAVNAGGESGNSSEVSAAPTLVAPAAPAGLTATASDSQVALSWSASVAATGYNVKRSTTSGAEVTIATTGTTSFTDSTAANGTPYFYVVSATNSVGEGANSSEVTATPIAYVAVYEKFNYSVGNLANNTPGTGTGETGNWTIPGGVPTIVTPGLTYPGLPVANNAYQHTASGSQNYIALATSSQMSSGTKYISYLMKGSGNSGGDTVGVYFKGNNSTSLFAGFRAPNSATLTGFSLGSVSSTTLGAASALGSTINISNNVVHLIVIKIDFNTSGVNDTINMWIDPPTGTNSPGVAANSTVTTFDVGTISALGINITGGYAAQFDEFRTGATYDSVVGYNPPATPTGLAATPGVNTVGLTWNAASGATGYRLLRGTSTGVYSVTNNLGTTSFTDNTAVGGTLYFYAVQATNASGVSANSAEVSALPTIALPNIPGGVVAVGTNGAVNLSWNVAAGASGYKVKRSTTSGAEVFLASTSSTSYSDASVVNGTPYFYKISSTNSAGESADSAEVTATPNLPPSTPTGLSAIAGTNQVALSWTGSAGAVTYNIKRSTTSGSGYATIATTTAPTVAYTDTTAVKFTQYYYVVSAASAYGEGANSSPEVTATPLGTYGPSAYEPFNYPVGILANATASTASGFTGNWTIPVSANIISNGLTYPGLVTANRAYQHVATASQNTVNLATALSSGTKYFSFLFKGSGNSGGDTVGLFLKGNNASSLFAGFRTPDTAVTTGFGLGTVNSTTLVGTSPLGSAVNISNATVHLIVLAIDFNTSGANDTVSLWIDPPAGTNAPGVAANVTNNTFDVGTISALGVNITGGYTVVVDEIRVGDAYGDVVGYLANQPPVASDLAMGAQAGVASILPIIGGKISPPSDPDGDPITVTSVSVSANGVTVTTDGTNVTYNAGLNVSGTDTFTYTVSDNRGGSVTKTVTVTVSGTSLNITLKPLNGNNEPVVGIMGIPGVTYAVDHSTNLTVGIGWTNVTQIALPLPPAGNGQYEFTHTGVNGQSGSHYYRTRYVSGP